MNKYIFTGSEFNELHKGTVFVKLLNYKENHGGYQFTKGLNVDKKYLGRSSDRLGFLFHDSANLDSIHTNYKFVRQVTIPPNATVYYDGKVMRSDILILSDRQTFIKYININRFMLLKNNGLLLQFFDNQTEDMCKVAIKQNPLALQ